MADLICVECEKERLKNQVTKEDSGKSTLAVVVYNGDSLCSDHFAESPEIRDYLGKEKW